jgi:hypothetical protein
MTREIQDHQVFMPPFPQKRLHRRPHLLRRWIHQLDHSESTKLRISQHTR